MVESSLSEDTGSVRAVVEAYLRDRYAYEMEAARLAARGADDEVLQAKYEEMQRRYRTDASAQRIGGFTYSEPPAVDPKRTRFVAVEISGARAVVRTLEDEEPGILPPYEYEYILERERDGWFLRDRRSSPSPDGSRGRLSGLL